MNIENFSKNIATKFLNEIKREKMPQVSSSDLSKVIEIFEENGVLVTREKISPSELNVTQENYNSEKVEKLVKKILSDKKIGPLLVSEDYSILDGHHRGVAGERIEKEKENSIKLPIVRFHLEQEKALVQLMDAVNKVKGKTAKMEHVVVYSDAFQPFHKKHYENYQKLVERFGVHNTFIATSDRTNKQNPFSFSDKQMIMTKIHPIPEQQIRKVENSWNPTEILEDYDLDETVFVVALPESSVSKLEGGNGNLFEEYDSSNLKPVSEKSFYYTLSNSEISIRENSVTTADIGKILNSDNIKESKKKKFFKSVFGGFSESVFSMVMDRTDNKNILKNEVIEAYLRDSGGRILSEISQTGRVAVDDGPTSWWHDQEEFEEHHMELARLIGYDFIEHIGLTDEDQILKTDGLPFNSFYPTGVQEDTPVSNPDSIYFPYVQSLVSGLGFEIIDYMGSREAPNYEAPSQDERDVKKRQLSKGIEDFRDIATDAQQDDAVGVQSEKPTSMLPNDDGYSIHSRLQQKIDQEAAEQEQENDVRSTNINENFTNIIDNMTTEKVATGKKFAIYPGRFQPFHSGHHTVYKNLVEEFGKENVFLAATNRVDENRSPFCFEEKKRIITDMYPDIPDGNIIEVKNPYRANKIIETFNKENDISVFVLGERDGKKYERLASSSYFIPYKEHGTYKPFSEHAYLHTVEDAGVDYDGNEISASQIRETFRDMTVPEYRKKELFKEAYGYFNKDTYEFIKYKLK